MYKLGHRPHSKQKLYALLILLVAGVVIAVSWLLSGYFKPDTTISESRGVVRHVEVATPKTKQISTNVFSLALPQNWQSTKSLFIPGAQYAWRGTSKDDASRRLDLYVDAIPAKMAVNRLLPLRASGNRVVVGDDISDNCVNFTDASKADKFTATVPAKWSGVDFYCDSGNYQRNLVGTGAPGSINSVTVTGHASGAHKFFFVYTDHGAEPDYTIFTDILNSLRVR